MDWIYRRFALAEPKKRHREELLSLLGGKVTGRMVDGGTSMGEGATRIQSRQLLKGLTECRREIADHTYYLHARTDSWFNYIACGHVQYAHVRTHACRSGVMNVCSVGFLLSKPAMENSQ